MKAIQISIETAIELSNGEQGKIIWNKSLQGDEIIVYEITKGIHIGAVGIANINDIKLV